SEEIKREALRSLAVFDDAKVPESLLAIWPKLPVGLRTDVVGIMCGRKSWAGSLLDALKKGTITKQDLSENDVRRIVALNDAELKKGVEAIGGRPRERTPEKIEEAIAKLRGQLAEHRGARKAGARISEKNCMVCQKLRGGGLGVAPDLPGANRRDIEYLLV